MGVAIGDRHESPFQVYRNLNIDQLVVSTPLKNMSQNGNLPQIRGENKTCLTPPSIVLHILVHVGVLFVATFHPVDPFVRETYLPNTESE